MGNNAIVNQFRGDEIAKVDNTLYPKVGGRLRLAHEQNHKLSITTNIIKYDGKIAVVSATSTTNKGSFQGFGMASIERDREIAPAILELAETRAIARSLRWASYGLEYCSAEEVSHLKYRNGIKPNSDQNHNQSEASQSAAGNGGNSTHGPGNGNGKGRLSGKQYKYLMQLADKLGKSKEDLDKHCLAAYGTVVQHLSMADPQDQKGRGPVLECRRPDSGRLVGSGKRLMYDPRPIGSAQAVFRGR